MAISLKTRIIYALFFSIASVITVAQPDLKTDRPESYTVVKGDTLWDISARFLEDPWRWKEIWKGNTQIANPDLIYPGDVIRLIFVDGKPQLVINDSVSVSSPAPTLPEVATPQKKPLKTVKLSPQIRAIPVEKAISTIPLEKINKFLSRNRVVEELELKNAPHVMAAKGKRIVLSAGDELYARGSFDTDILNYGIYRKGLVYKDPETKEPLGIQAIDIGSVNINRVSGDIGTFSVVRSAIEVRIGDHLLPSAERKITSNFIPEPIQLDKQGEIMTVEKGVSQAGPLDIIAINLGKREGLIQGSLLGIFNKGEKIRDRNAKKKTPRSVTLPDERAGVVMVFQTFEKMSLGIILEADHGVVLGDIITGL